MPFFFGRPDIEKLKSKHNIKGLTKALTYMKDPIIRIQAVQALSQFGDTRATQALIAALKDAEPTVCIEAVRALGQIGDAKAADPLIALLNDNHFAYRAHRHQYHKRAIVSVRDAALNALVKIGVSAIKSLSVALKDEVIYVRISAAEVLGQIGGASAAKLLTDVFKTDQDQSVRDAVAEALINIGALAIEPLSDFFKDKDKYVRVSAAQMLGQIGGASAAKLLTDVFETERFDVRDAIVEALIKIGDRRALKFLIALLETFVKNKLDLYYATKTLGQIGGDYCIELLFAFLRHNDYEIRKAALSGLRAAGWEAHDDIERAACRIVKGDVNRLTELDCQTIKQLLIESMEWQMAPENWYVKGRIAKLLVRPEIATNDSILAQAVDELEIYAKKYAEILDRMVRNPKPIEAKRISYHANSPLRPNVHIYYTDESGKKKVATLQDYSELVFWHDQIIFEDYAELIIKATSFLADRPILHGNSYYDTSPSLSAIEDLCKIMTPVSTNLLHHLSQLEDQTVITRSAEVRYDVDPSGTVANQDILSFERHRDTAARELARRSNSEYDLSAYKAEDCWRLPKQ